MVPRNVGIRPQNCLQYFIFRHMYVFFIVTSSGHLKLKVIIKKRTIQMKINKTLEENRKRRW
jgi:hypothetical protein